MSSRVTPVHKWAAVYWLALTVWVVVYAWFFPDAPWYVFAATLAAFFGPEAWAIRNRTMGERRGVMVPLRDTYSEVLTWFARFSKDGAPWYAWTNGAVVFVALHWGWIVMHQPSSLALGIPAGLITTVALSFHWLRPDLVG